MMSRFILPTSILIWNFLVAQARSSTGLEKGIQEEENEYFTNSWVVRVLGGVNKAKLVALKLGFDGDIGVSDGLPDFYLFRNSKYPEKMQHAERNVTKKLRERSEIKWAQQQIALKLIPTMQFPSIGIPFSKQIRSFLSWDDPEETKEKSISMYWGACLPFNDEYWPRQYYIQDCRDRKVNQPLRDLNVAPVWINHRLFGKNVKVLVIDDGIETTHVDLAENYDPSLGLDLQDEDSTPDPRHFWWHKFTHGTRCAGVIAMKANNSVCGVGIAPSVTLGAVRLVGPKMLSEFEIIRALLFKYNEIDIVSNSWALRDTGKSAWFTGLLSLSAIKAGVIKGRKGKGIIYIFACGTKKSSGDNCGRDPVRNCIYTISVSSCDSHGKITSFSERCASIMVTTYSGDGSRFRNNVIATDIENGCIASHSGTSASAPMVAGAVALLLEANPILTWRDVQHLLTWTCQFAPLQKNPSSTWKMNAAGFYVSHDFGFGLLNINDLVEQAKKFQNVPPMSTCVTEAKLWKGKRHFHTGLKVNITADGCKNTPSEVMYLEHVQVTLSLKYPKRGDLQIELTSPAGTKATLLEPRPFDTYALGIPAWTFESVMTWGENPRGTWTFQVVGKSQRFTIGTVIKTVWSTLKDATGMMDEITQNSMDDEPHSNNVPGELKELYLIFYGTSEKNKPQHYKAGPRSYHH